MKKITLVVLVLAFAFKIEAQSTERFIRIVGNSKKELKADTAKLLFTISAVKEDTQKEIESKSFDMVKQEVVGEFLKINVFEDEIKLVPTLPKRYNRLKSKKYSVNVSLEQLNKITDIDISGLNITEIKFIFTNLDNDLETQLTLEAIEDAKRKAKNISDKVGLKLGEILNIEDKSNNSPIRQSKTDNFVKTYKVSVTFKLD